MFTANQRRRRHDQDCIDINVHHLTRVEGHGNIVVNVADGKVEKCEWQVPEAPRFFEAMVRGRHYTEVARITSRICGICSVGHTLASVKATEDALGIEVTRADLEAARAAEARRELRLPRPARLLPGGARPAGRAVGVPARARPTARWWRGRCASSGWATSGDRSSAGARPTRRASVPGGFTSCRPRRSCSELKRERCWPPCPTSRPRSRPSRRWPPSSRPSTGRPSTSALSIDEDYGLYDGDIQTVLPDGTKERYPVADYKRCTNEYVVPQSTAKYTQEQAATRYAAGALARFNNNYDQSASRRPRRPPRRSASKPICTNPYMNTVAQVVEIVQRPRARSS